MSTSLFSHGPIPSISPRAEPPPPLPNTSEGTSNDNALSILTRTNIWLSLVEELVGPNGACVSVNIVGAALSRLARGKNPNHYTTPHTNIPGNNSVPTTDFFSYS